MSLSQGTELARVPEAAAAADLSAVMGVPSAALAKMSEDQLRDYAKSAHLIMAGYMQGVKAVPAPSASPAPSVIVHNNNSAAPTGRSRCRGSSSSCKCAYAECKESILVIWEDVEARAADLPYKVCSRNCSNPLAAHKKCLARILMATGKKVLLLDGGCSCGEPLRLEARSLRVGDLPVAVPQLKQTKLSFFLHNVVYPMIAYCVLMFLLWLSARMDWKENPKKYAHPGPLNQYRATLTYDDGTEYWNSDSPLWCWLAGFVVYHGSYIGWGLTKKAWAWFGRKTGTDVVVFGLMNHVE